MEQGERIASLEAKMVNVSGSLEKHLEDCAGARKENNERFQRLERVIWAATGIVSFLTFVIPLFLKRL